MAHPPTLRMPSVAALSSHHSHSHTSHTTKAACRIVRAAPAAMMLEPIRVSFKCRAYTLAAHLYTPAEGSPRRGGAAVVICPPWTGVKEQAPSNYARVLAAAGFTCLCYDAVFQGESTGEPRCLEDPAQRVEDVKAAVTYLISRDDLVDRRRIGVLGICASGGYACTAAQTDVRIAAVATLSAVCMGAMARRGLDQNFGDGTLTVLQARLEVASVDRNSDITGRKMGTMQVLPRHFDPAHPPKGMSESFCDLASYYRTDRGRHPRAPNTCLPRSWDLMANYDAFQWNRMISPRPVLAIAGTKAATRWFSEDAVARAADERAELFMVEGFTHADLYDHVDVAGEKLVEYFARFLASKAVVKEERSPPPPRS